MKSALKKWLGMKTTRAALLAFISQALKSIPASPELKITFEMGADLLLGFCIVWLASGYGEN